MAIAGTREGRAPAFASYVGFYPPGDRRGRLVSLEWWGENCHIYLWRRERPGDSWGLTEIIRDREYTIPEAREIARGMGMEVEEWQR